MLDKIPGNVIKDSGGMFERIPGNVQEDSRESKFRFISWNLTCFSSIFAVKLLQNIGKSNYWAILLMKTFSSLRLITNLLSLITVFLT